MACRAICNQQINAVIPNEGIDSKYVYYYARTLRHWMEANASETTITILNKGRFEKAPIELPPLAEQRRIVAKVEELLARVNVARERLAKVPSLLKRFRQSVLAAACSGQLTEDWREENVGNDTGRDLVTSLRGQPPENCELSYSIPDQWTVVACRALCDEKRALTYGVIKLGPPVENGVPVLRSSDVRSLLIDERGIKRIGRGIADQFKRTYLEGGEVVVTVRGTLGGVAVVPDRMKGYNISREVAVIPFDSRLNRRFFALAIASLPSQNWLTGVEKGVAYTGVNIEDLKCLPLPVPPLAEQREIVRRVDALFALADKIEARATSATARVEKITQAILAKAFRGELVPTEAELARQEGRSYESASALLERIRAEREALEPLDGERRKSKQGRNAKRKSRGEP